MGLAIFATLYGSGVIATLASIGRAQSRRIAADECDAPEFDSGSITFDPYI
jgi:hypothetical protein